MQIELEFNEPKKQPTIRDIPTGQPAQHNGNMVMRVKATGFMLNSTIVADVYNRGDCLVVNLAKGTVYAVKGSDPVVPLVGNISMYRKLS